MNKYLLNLAPDYCRDWIAADAIREILQNCLDDVSAFQYNFDGNELHLTSVGVTLPASTLLLGSTTKFDESDSVGGFGEGYKISLLVLLREGFEVRIHNGNKLWVPSFEHQEQYQCDMLVVNETLPAELSDNTNLTFIVQGVSDDLREEVISKCLYLQPDLEEVLEGETGRIITNSVGQLFVGGLYVTTTTMNYSYDFNPSVLTLNRDRKNVCTWDLSYETGRLWNDIKSPKEISEMLHKGIPDIKNVHHTGSSDIDEESFNIYSNEHGNKKLASGYYDHQKMSEQGIESIYIENTEFADSVLRSNSYQALTFETKEGLESKTPTEMLEDAYSEASKCQIFSDTYELFEDLIELFNDRGVIWDE